MKNVIITSFIFIFSLFFSIDVKASSVPVYVHDLSYNNWSLLNGGWNSFSIGNRNINFGYSLDSSLTDRWVYNSLVLCSDSTFQGGIIPSGYRDYIRNINYNHTPYTCSYNNSSYTGYVVLINWQTYIDSESGGSFDGYFTVYQDVNVSIQLIDFVVNSNNYVSGDNYASQSLINQNSQIINQNTTIINQNNQQLQEQQETNDKLDNITDMDIPESSKEDLDDSTYQDYQGAEDNLLDSVGEADLSNIDIAIDSDSSNFIWDTITDIFQSHPLIMSTVIAILSIGIIKLALGR